MKKVIGTISTIITLMILNACGLLYGNGFEYEAIIPSHWEDFYIPIEYKQWSLEPYDGDTVITLDQAIEIAQGERPNPPYEIETVELLKWTSAMQFLYLEDASPRLREHGHPRMLPVFVVKFIRVPQYNGDFSSWNVIVDAHSGHILASYSGCNRME